MKVSSIKFIVVFISIYFHILKNEAQEHPLNYSVALNTVAATDSTLPFWLTVNSYGRIPNIPSRILMSSIYSTNTKVSSPVHFSYKAATIGYQSENKSALFIDELYGTIGYKYWALDLGLKHDAVLWEGISSSNGNITKSLNARAIPGYNLQLTDFVGLPFVKRWVSIKASYGDYLLNDTRSVTNTRLHQKNVFLKIQFNKKIGLIWGINHYAQWGGTSEKYGKQPTSFKDYLRVITGSSGGNNALLTDQINVLGNQLGSYLLQIDYKGINNNWNLYWSHPFEDGSGIRLANYPDALYGFFINFKKKPFISHILVEFTYTKNSSGNTKHYTDEYGVTHTAKGRDNYFNNGIYQSGWTYFGNTVGSPYFTTKPINENGITHGVIVGDNRFMAFNIGVKGVIKKFQYKTVLSHTTYFGWFDEEYLIKPYQFSGLLEVIIPQVVKLPFQISFGSAFDVGSYRPTNFGGFIKFTKKGVF